MESDGFGQPLRVTSRIVYQFTQTVHTPNILQVNGHIESARRGGTEGFDQVLHADDFNIGAEMDASLHEI